MTEQSMPRKDLMEEIANRKRMGGKKFHSETSLQHYAEEEAATPDAIKDPGVLNLSINDVEGDEQSERRRTMSQPGPMSGSLLTATAARAARKRPPKNVMYAPDLDRNESSNDKQSPKFVFFTRGDDSGNSTPIGDRNYSPLSYNTNTFRNVEGKSPSDRNNSPLPYNNNNFRNVDVKSLGDRTNSPLPYNTNNFRNGDVKSLSSYRLYMPADNGTPRKRSLATMDAQSIRSMETLAPPPTSPEDNKKLTKKYLTLIMSCIYAVMIVTLGLIINIGDAFVTVSASIIFSIGLSSTGFLYLIFLIIDINRYKSIALKNQKIKGMHEENIADFFRKQEEDFGQSTPGDRTPEAFRGPGLPAPVLIPLKHQYCFSQGRHSGSFYLKLGAAGFALGHLVHSLLLITVEIGYWFDDNINNEDCVNILQIILDVIFPFYCFVQLYFIFKYSNVIILRAQGLAHFAFMHMIGSSLCFWMSAIARETMLGLTIYANSIYGQNDTARISKTPGSSARFIDISGLHNEKCVGSTAITTIVESFSPYLFPFSVEFNILIVAVYYIIWDNIGNCDNDGTNSETNSTIDDNFHICKIPTASEDNDFTSNIVIHADCHASNRGLFAGLIVVVIILGMLIIGFVFSSVGEDFLELGYLLNDGTKLALHGIMLFASIVALNQIRKLDINEHPISLLDDVLLFICLPAFFMETLLSMIATINILNIVKTIDFVVMVIQVIIQTPLIMDGLRRCSNSKKLRRKKPGRELLMFLLIVNVGTWIFYTFSYKSPESLDERYAYYGKVMWTILGHISLPLIMFYRFHSSVCFADIWDSAYKPGAEH